MRHQAQRRPRTCEVRRAMAQHDRMQVHPVLVDQAEFGEAAGQVGAGHFDLAVTFGLQLPDRAREIVTN